MYGRDLCDSSGNETGLSNWTEANHENDYLPACPRLLRCQFQHHWMSIVLRL